jgi:DNA repair protein RecO (recombination protein O)
VRVQAGKGHLAVLQEAELARHFPNVIADLGRMAAGYAAIELLRELCPESHPEPDLLELGLEMLAALDDTRTEPEVLTIGFETRLLALSGFSPMLDACGSCGKQPAPMQPAAFDPVHGHLVCRACGGASEVLSGITRAALAQATTPDWRDATAGLTPSERRAAARAMRSLAEHRLGRTLFADRAWSS